MLMTSEREALNETSVDSNEMNSTYADEDERETNYTTARLKTPAKSQTKLCSKIP